jgi:hypothetical protein
MKIFNPNRAIAKKNLLKKKNLKKRVNDLIFKFKFKNAKRKNCLFQKRLEISKISYAKKKQKKIKK